MTSEQLTVAQNLLTSLRAKKELIKIHIGKLQNEMTEIDIQIRDIRQTIGHQEQEEKRKKIAQAKPKPSTLEEKKQILIAKINAIDKKLAEIKKHE